VLVRLVALVRLPRNFVTVNKWASRKVLGGGRIIHPLDFAGLRRRISDEHGVVCNHPYTLRHGRVGGNALFGRSIIR